MKSFVCVVLLCVACNDKSTLTATTTKPAFAKGQQLYLANCIACHSADPKKDGVLGPALAGSSRALIEARVMRAAYPDGYTPKRDTKTMLALPHLAASIDDLAAFLNP